MTLANHFTAGHGCEDAAARELRKIPIEEYADSVERDATRAARMYIDSDVLFRGTGAPDAVGNACMTIADTWLAALASLPCDTPEAREAKLAGLLHYLIVEGEERLELPDDIAEIVEQIRAASPELKPREASRSMWPAFVVAEEAQG
jgi:hypothetical protein